MKAIPKLLQKYELSLTDIDVIEINEAFASMAVYCRDELNLDWSKLNPRGRCSGEAVAMISEKYTDPSRRCHRSRSPLWLYRRETNRHWSERVQTKEMQSLVDEHVHGHWNGCRGALRQ